MTASHSDMKLSQGERVARGVLWVGVERYGQQAVSFATFITLSRLLSPAAFGLFAMGLMFTDLVETLIDLGIGAAVVQRAELDNGHLNTAFVTTVAIGIVCA